MPHDNEKWYSHSVYDENLNPVFESKNIDAFYVKKIGNSVFADLGDYFTIINNEGKEFPNMKLYMSDLRQEIYNRVENSALKEKPDYEVYANGIVDIYFEDMKNDIVILIDYKNEYYETYITLKYHYSFETNTLELIEENSY